MLRRFTTGRVAVFIDAANVFYAQKNLGWRISYEKLKKYFERECTGSRVFLYNAIDPNNTGQIRFVNKLESFGLEVVSRRIKKIRTSSGTSIIKGNVDIELSMGMLEHINSYDTAILMSGDSDFAPVVDKIKRLGKNTVVISTDRYVSRELLDRAKYIDIEELKGEVKFDDKV